MKEVVQTITAPPNGNCWAACVASILDLPLEEVPNYHFESMGQWSEEWQQWFIARNLRLLYYDPLGGAPLGYSILTGKSPRGDWLHSVVALNGEIVWDPAPGEGRMTLRDRQEYAAFQILDPSKTVRVQRGTFGSRDRWLGIDPG